MMEEAESSISRPQDAFTLAVPNLESVYWATSSQKPNWNALPQFSPNRFVQALAKPVAHSANLGPN
jgi:hypothetical protein